MRICESNRVDKMCVKQCFGCGLKLRERGRWTNGADDDKGSRR